MRAQAFGDDDALGGAVARDASRENIRCDGKHRLLIAADDAAELCLHLLHSRRRRWRASDDVAADGGEHGARLWCGGHTRLTRDQ